METVKRSGASRYGECRGRDGQVGLGGSEMILHDTIMVHTGHFTFVQTHRTNNTKSDSNINRGLWVMTMCPCGFIDGNKRTIWGDDADGGDICLSLSQV